MNRPLVPKYNDGSAEPSISRARSEFERAHDALMTLGRNGAVSIRTNTLPMVGGAVCVGYDRQEFDASGCNALLDVISDSESVTMVVRDIRDAHSGRKRRSKQPTCKNMMRSGLPTVQYDGFVVRIGEDGGIGLSGLVGDGDVAIDMSPYMFEEGARRGFAQVCVFVLEDAARAVLAGRVVVDASGLINKIPS